MKLSNVYAAKIAVVTHIIDEGIQEQVRSKPVPGNYIIKYKSNSVSKMLIMGIEVYNSVEDITMVGDLYILYKTNIGKCINKNYLSKKQLAQMEEYMNTELL